MEFLKNFLEFRELGIYLVGNYGQAFDDIFGFISYVGVILFVVWSLQWVPPFSAAVRAIQKDNLVPFEENYLIKELIPKKTYRFRFYRALMWAEVFLMTMGYLGSFYYGSAAVASLLAENLEVNRYTAFTILSALTILMFLLGAYYLKDANKLAKFLHENHG